MKLKNELDRYSCMMLAIVDQLGLQLWFSLILGLFHDADRLEVQA